MSDQPVLPYGGSRDPNSGHAGSETSKARAVADDTSGRTSRRQRAVLDMLTTYGPTGVTYSELGLRLGLHHGQSSGVLSNLHRAGRIVRLREVRHRCKVYVLPQFVQDRPVEPAGRVARPGLGPVADEMARLLRTVTSETVRQDREIADVLAEYDRIVHR